MARMPAKMKADWCDALRSGSYLQVSGWLSRDDGFCCLGVLQKMLDGEVQDASMPSMEWYESKGIEVCSNGFGVGIRKGIARTEYLTHMNDSGRTFLEIADIIEKYVEGY